MRVLLLLVEQPNIVISRQYLLDSVWPETYSGEEALTRCISLLRANLGENRQARRFIETVSKSGYRLIAPVVASTSTAQTRSSAGTNRTLVYTAFSLVLLAAGFQVAARFFLPGQQAANQASFETRSSQNFPVVRFTISVGEEAELFLGGVQDTTYGRPDSPSLAISNDGNLLVYSGWKDGPDKDASQLYVRRLDEERAEPIAGTEGGQGPFLSPDDEWVGFFAGKGLHRVPLGGGNVETIVADVSQRGFSASWGDDGTIVYTDDFSLYQVAASGGNRTLILDPRGETQASEYTQPHLFPGSKLLLLAARSRTRNPELAEIIALNLATGTQTPLLINAMNPIYVAATRHLLFMRQGTLMAVGFDADLMTIEGEPVIVQEDVLQALDMPNVANNTGTAALGISATGHLIYAKGGVFKKHPEVIMRVPVDGEAQPFSSIPPAPVIHPRLSPDGSRLAFIEPTGIGGNLLVHNLENDVTQLLSTGPFRNAAPVWSPDGNSIAFSSNRTGGFFNIYSIAADGSDKNPQRLAPSAREQTTLSWSVDGTIAYFEANDIWIIPPGEEPKPFFTSDARELYASFSPNGEWLAYSAYSSIERESIGVYVRPYPGPGAAILVSGDRGLAPTWSPDGSQLYFRQEGRMMVVDMIADSPPRARVLIDEWRYEPTTPARNYDVLPDGSFIAVVMADRVSASPADQLSTRLQNVVTEFNVVLNFAQELRQRMVN